MNKKKMKKVRHLWTVIVFIRNGGIVIISVFIRSMIITLSSQCSDGVKRV